MSAAPGRFAGSGLVALAAFACGEPGGGVQLDLPPIVAESKYLRAVRGDDDPPLFGSLTMVDGFTGELAAGRYHREIEAGDGREIEVTARRLGP